MTLFDFMNAHPWIGTLGMVTTMFWISLFGTVPLGMNDEMGLGGFAVIGLGLIGILAGLCYGIPSFFRYQSRESAENDVKVTAIQIQNTSQLVEVERKKAEVRVAEAHGIAESQRIINTSLTSNYLQYLAIGAQKEMAHSPNHTQIYIPSGANGIPLVKTVDAPQGDPKKVE